jgi:uncharacterized protein (UPF0332 family)
MPPEAASFLEKATQLLEQATTMLRVNLNEDAGRTAYLAGFHAATALPPPNGLFQRICVNNRHGSLDL